MTKPFLSLAIAAGRIDRGMPLVKSNIVTALLGSYTTEEQAMQKISSNLLQSPLPFCNLGGK